MAAADTQIEKLIKSADLIVAEKAPIRVNGHVASLRTQEYTRQVMRETCRRLHRLGYMIEDVTAIRERHIDAILKSWLAQGLANKTMQCQYSALKKFCGWLGRPGIIDHSGQGVAGQLEGLDPKDFKVSTVAKKSRSWSGNGIDVVAKINEVRRDGDSRFAAMMLMGIGFGLRKKEQLKIRPWHADKGDRLVLEGSIAKGGRKREIPIEPGDYGLFQRWCLDQTKKQCKKHETLGWPELSYKQAENRYYSMVKKHGFTKELMGVCMHGLRAEFAENMAIIRGLMPPSLGGSITQMPKVQREVITTQISGMLGHNKLHTIGAYFSSFRKLPRTDGVGERIGSMLVSDADETFAGVYCNPAVCMAVDRSYRHKTESERADTVVTIFIEKVGAKQESFSLEQFVSVHGELEGKLTKMLSRVGLGELPPAVTGAG